MKRQQELAYTRRADELADDAWDVAMDLAGPGASEARILADMQGAVLGGGGDYAGNEMIIGSGPGALMVRYTSGRQNLAHPCHWGGLQNLVMQGCAIDKQEVGIGHRRLLFVQRRVPIDNLSLESLRVIIRDNLDDLLMESRQEDNLCV